MADNTYEHVASEMDKLPKEARKKFLNDFWVTMDREAKIVFAIDAITFLNNNGSIEGFLKDANELFAKEQDVVMDEYLSKKTNKEAFLEKMGEVKKIEILIEENLKKHF